MSNWYYITPEDYKEAAKNGICKDTLETRVRKLGWNVKKATTKEVRKKRKISEELLEKAKELGIDRNTISSRIGYGWSVEEACTKPKKAGRDRLYPNWVYEEANKNNIRYSTINSRVKRGWSLQEACTKSPLSKEESVKKMRDIRKIKNGY